MSAIDKLVSEVSTHLAVNNKFYLLWERQQLTSDQVKVFIRNFYAWTYKFPEALASILNISSEICFLRLKAL
jgi:pyrroloquinoline quinone (PQQ) biosynthesis protein C